MQGPSSFQNVIANTVIIVGPSGGEFIYSSSPPVLGNLISSDTGAAGTDPYGNTFLAGKTTYLISVVPPHKVTAINIHDNVITWQSAATPSSSFTLITSIGATTQSIVGQPAIKLSIGAANTGEAIALADPVFGPIALYNSTAFGGNQATISQDGNGYIDYTIATAGDGNTYNAGKSCTVKTTTQLVNSGAFANVGSALNVLAGQKYRYTAMVEYTGSQSAGNPILSLLHSTATMTYTFWRAMWTVSGGSAPLTNNGTSSAFTDLTGPGLTGGQFIFEITGVFIPSANGNLTLSAACTIAADTWTINGAILEIEPVEG
jgi:hypothetical protein